MTGAVDLVGAQARAWLERARQLESTFSRVVALHEKAVHDIARAVALQQVGLPGRPVRQGVPPSALAGATALVLEPSPPDGAVQTIERWAAAEFHLAPAAREAQRALVPLQSALPAARRTAGRIRWAFTGRAHKAEAAEALEALMRIVEQIAGSELESACARLATQVPLEPAPTPFPVDPTYVLNRAATALSLRGPSDQPQLLGPADLETARQIVFHGGRALHNRPELVEEVRHAFRAVQDRMVAAQLADIPTRTLKDVTDGRIRFKSLEDQGFTSVADVLRGNRRIVSVKGISEIAARQVLAAARQVEKAIRDDLRFRIDLDRTDRLVTRLISVLFALLTYDAAFAGKGDELQAAVDFLEPLTVVDKNVKSVALFSPRRDTSQLTAEVRRWAEWYHRSGLAELLLRMPDVRGAGASPDDAWQDFESRSAAYYAALGKIVGLKMDDDAAAGFMPKEIVERVHAQELDDSFLRVSLRGYQSFGARYALVQRKVILGDEMGLGKTIQSLAVMAHLRAGGKQHFLVVCPASVLINWVREVTAKTTLRAFHVHGLDRDRAWRSWQRHGGVAVTTYDTLRALKTADIEIALLTVDEAHYVKNPTTIRAQQVLGYVGRAERTLFMTGTPMENRVDEFKQLVDYLQPDVGARLSVTDGLTGGHRFRSKVAPAYLRRNTVDVLQELPELVQTEEWEEFSDPERHAYRDEVRDGHFMGMRRVAFVASPRTSTKLARLRELTEEASSNGTKVIVFSYFRDVLDVVKTSLGPQVIGPLTGGLSAARRQELVDDFTKAKGPAVLLSQIQAGGVGLNMQAGSVVVLCEPQVKPSLEAQAIARAHRMGQVRTVQVHRLLITDSVDQRMLEILDSKQKLFDEYARGSDVANLSPEAVDVSEKKLAREVVAAEQERMARELAEQLAAQYEDVERDQSIG